MRKIGRAVLLFAHIGIGLILALIIHRGGKVGGDYQPGAKASAVTSWWFQRFCRILNVKLTVHGKLADEPVLLVGNHISWLDIPVLGTQGPLGFVSKADVRHWPVVGWLCLRVGTLFVQRGSGRAGAAAVEQLQHRLKQGSPVVVFPEGTTSLGNRLGRFHPSMFQAAVWSEVPVQAVSITYWQGDQPYNRSVAYIDDDVFAPHLLNLLQEKVIRIDLHFSEPFSSEEHNRRQLAELSRGFICERLQLEEDDSEKKAA